jgi:hypothetical protein
VAVYNIDWLSSVTLVEFLDDQVPVKVGLDAIDLIQVSTGNDDGSWRCGQHRGSLGVGIVDAVVAVIAAI